MTQDPSKLECQINTFGYPLTRLVADRRLQVRSTAISDLSWQHLVARWHRRNEHLLRQAGRKS